MIYQDPLAYLLGLEGIALLDAWAGDHDRDFTQTRLAEIRRLLDDERLRDRGVLVEQVSAATVYERVSAGYDADAGGGLFATDEPSSSARSRSTMSAASIRYWPSSLACCALAATWSSQMFTTNSSPAARR